MTIQEAIQLSSRSGFNYDAARIYADARSVLQGAREHQTLYWKSLSQLETLLGVEIDHETDLETVTVQSLVEGVQ